jgi:alkylated DNA repair dioxygenase AlkB
VIVNEYEPGQGIAAHVDCVPCFGETITSLSLASPCVMDFMGKEGEKAPQFLEPRSLVVLSGPARYQWRHSIAPRKTDKYQGDIIPRRRRLSLTFRNVRIP